MIWAIIKRKLKKQEIKSKEDLVSAVYSVWNSLDQSMIDNLVRDFNRRIDLVVSVNEASISQYLSSHMAQPKDLEDERIQRRIFSSEEDQILLQHVERLGHKWKMISAKIGWPSLSMVKNRYWMLMRIQRNQKLDSYHQLPPISVLLERLVH